MTGRRMRLSLAAVAMLAATAAPAEETDINATIADLLARMQAAEPYSAAQDQLGLELVEIIVVAKGDGVSDATIDLMASVMSSDSSHVRIFVSHALAQMGPKARRALPALRQAADADDKTLQDTYTIEGVPDGPNDAEHKAIEAIIGPPSL